MRIEMKTLFYIAIGALLASCDYVTQPEIEQADFNDELYDVPEFSENTNEDRNVLIEDFTGHVCGNCPGAAVVADDIMEDYPDRVFTLAVHAGSLAEPENGPKYTTDWTTPEGEVYWEQVGAPGYPVGRVSRNLGIDQILPPSLWRSFAEEIMDDNEINVKMQLIAEYHVGPSHLNVHAETEFINDLEGSYNVVICLIESHMLDWQLNYVDTGDPDYPIGDVEDYEFNHVFRGTINGALGALLRMDPVDGDMDITSYTYDYNTDWVVENTEVIAYVYNTETGLVENVVESEITIIE